MLTIGRFNGGIVDVYLWWCRSGWKLVQLLPVCWHEIHRALRTATTTMGSLVRKELGGGPTVGFGTYVNESNKRVGQVGLKGHGNRSESCESKKLIN